MDEINQHQKTIIYNKSTTWKLVTIIMVLKL